MLLPPSTCFVAGLRTCDGSDMPHDGPPLHAFGVHLPDAQLFCDLLSGYCAI
jgi:hypothetical protein